MGNSMNPAFTFHQARHECLRNWEQNFLCQPHIETSGTGVHWPSSSVSWPSKVAAGTAPSCPAPCRSPLEPLSLSLHAWRRTEKRDQFKVLAWHREWAGQEEAGGGTHLLMVTNPQYERLRPSRPPVFLPLLPDLSASSQCPLDELLLGRAKTPTAGFGFHFGADPLLWTSLPAGDLA